jgi:ATP-dependent Lon protease
MRFVGENRPILCLGQPGCGKTHLAVALAICAVEAGWHGYFTGSLRDEAWVVGFPRNRGGSLVGDGASHPPAL